MFADNEKITDFLSNEEKAIIKESESIIRIVYMFDKIESDMLERDCFSVFIYSKDSINTISYLRYRSLLNFKFYVQNNNVYQTNNHYESYLPDMTFKGIEEMLKVLYSKGYKHLHKPCKKLYSHLKIDIERVQ